MKVVCCETFGPPDTLIERDVPLPVPGNGELRVRIHATGIGFVDGLLIQGRYQVKPTLPYCPGSEFAGVVDAVGEQVDGFAVGDRVYGSANAALADYALTTPDRCFPTPSGLDDARAASLYVNYLTAVYGLETCGRLQPGETLLVLGAAGGVGAAAISVGRAMGLRVIAAASSPAKRDAALGFGADACVDYSVANWRDALKALLGTQFGGAGLNAVYDPVGGAAAEPALRSLAPGGRFLVVGFASGEIPKFPANLALLKRCSIVGVDWGGEIRANPQVNASLARRLRELMADGLLEPAAVSTRPASEFVAAFTDQLAGRITGKLVLLRQSASERRD